MLTCLAHVHEKRELSCGLLAALRDRRAGGGGVGRSAGSMVVTGHPSVCFTKWQQWVMCRHTVKRMKGHDVGNEELPQLRREPLAALLMAVPQMP